MSQSGTCLCGGVTYTIKSKVTETRACHCGMCRKWSGGVYLGIQVAADQFEISGADTLTTFTSSPWAERAFCTTCGCNIYSRITAPGPHFGTHYIGLGTLDDPNGIALSGEIYIDKKPDGYAFANDTHKMTEAEIMAMFAPSVEV